MLHSMGPRQGETLGGRDIAVLVCLGISNRLTDNLIVDRELWQYVILIQGAGLRDTLVENVGRAAILQELRRI